jgi:elongation factor G
MFAQIPQNFYFFIQAQTYTVWQQQTKFKLPTIFFLNKMDKPGASLKYSIESIKNRLGANGLHIATSNYQQKLIYKI